MSSDVKARAAWSLAVTALLLVLLPGIRYFNPTGDGVLRLYLLLIPAWVAVDLLFLLPPALQKKAPWLRFAAPLLSLATGVVLLQALLFFGAILAVFFRGVGLLLLAAMAAMMWSCYGRGRRRPFPQVVLVAAALIPLTGMLCGWWNFLLIGAGKYDPRVNPPSVQHLIAWSELQEVEPTLGAAHPYYLAFDPEADLLVASFKDDWGAIFPRRDTRRHNYLVARQTQGEPQWRFLFFGPSQQPENLILDPRLRRGWVNVLDVARRTFHVAAFAYDAGGLQLTRMGDLPVEPNAIFYHAGRDRLYVLSIRKELLELDPSRLEIVSRVVLSHRLKGGGPQHEMARSLLGEELVNHAAFYHPQKDRLYMGGLGRFLYETPLGEASGRRVALGPQILQLDYAADKKELWAGLPWQRQAVALDAESLTVKRRLATGAAIRPLAVIPRSHSLLVGDYAANRTVLLDRESGAVLAEYRLGRLQRHALADPHVARVFVATGWGVFAVDASRP